MISGERRIICQVWPLNDQVMMDLTYLSRLNLISNLATPSIFNNAHRKPCLTIGWEELNIASVNSLNLFFFQLQQTVAAPSPVNECTPFTVSRII